MLKLILVIPHVACGLLFLMINFSPIESQPLDNEVQVEEDVATGEIGRDQEVLEAEVIRTEDRVQDLQEEVGEVRGQVEQLADRIQEDERRIEALREELGGENSIFRFGVSMGPRILRLKSEEKVDFLDPFLSGVYLDSVGNRTLQVNKSKDKSAWLISAVLGITPGRNLEKDESSTFGHFIRSRSTFILNVNLSTLANSKNSFNERIEGGIGYGLEIHNRFAMGVTLERVFNRALHEKIRDELEGQALILDGQPVLELDENDDQLFRDQDLTAWSFKFILYY
jgi:hypothetical protein